MGKIITPGTAGWASRRKSDSFGKARDKATPDQWLLVDEAIKAFIAVHPEVWTSFVADMKAKETEMAIAKEGGLKKSDFRCVAEFPCSLDAEGNIQHNLLTIIEKIIPKLTAKRSVNFQEFIRRYPVFRPSSKSNHSQLYN